MKIFYFNPDYIIRPDGDRYLLSNRRIRRYDSDEINTFIHPWHAWILSLFTNGCSIENAIGIIAEKFNISVHESNEILKPWIENKQQLEIRIRDINILIPRNVIIFQDKIDRTETLESINIPLPSFKWVDLATQRHATPHSLTFMLTNRCLTNCCYCYADKRRNIGKPLSVERILEIIHQAKDIGVYNISLIGGEVFLYPKWDIILKELIDNGFCPDVISTKMPLTEELIDKIIKTGYNGKIQFSLDTINYSIAKHMLGVDKDYLKKFLHGILLFEKHSSIQYRIETVLTKDNACEKNISELFSFLNERENISAWEIRAVMFSCYNSERNFLSIRPSKDNLIRLYQYIDDNIAKKASFKIITSRSEFNKRYFYAEKGSSSFEGSKCSALNHHLFVLPDGKCTICEQLYWNQNFVIGDLNADDILSVWNSPKALELLNIEQHNINPQSACHNCSFYEDCFKIYRNRCWVDIIKSYGENNWDFPDPRCKFAPKVMRDVNYL